LFRPGGNLSSVSSNTADMVLRLSADADTTQIAEALRQRLEGSASDREVLVSEFQGGGPPEGKMELVVSGESYQALVSASTELMGALRDIPGLANVKNDAAAARPEMVINVDPVKAMMRGLTALQIGMEINSLLVSKPATKIELDGKTVDVILRGRLEDMDTVAEVRDLNVGRGGTTLGDVAEVSLQDGPVQIVRIDGKQAMSITGSIVNEDTEAVNQEVSRILDTVTLPEGVEVATGGVFEQIDEIFVSMGVALAVAVLLVYLVMVASLGSLLNPLVIILSLPLASIGALGALFITHRDLGIPALMGTLLLVGLVVTNAIVLITFVEQLREGGMSVRQALERGGSLRVRPILMTAFTTIFALLPLAIFVPESAGIVGAELATVVIGGLITSTFLTLVVVPVLYSYAKGMNRQSE